MIDIEKQIDYWRNGANEDWEVAQELVERGRTRHGVLFAHVALEKAIKADVCRQTRDLAPRIHNLVRLAELSGIPARIEQMKVLAEMNVFNIEGRYPNSLSPPPKQAEARAYLSRAGEVFQWLMSQL